MKREQNVRQGKQDRISSAWLGLFMRLLGTLKYILGIFKYPENSDIPSDNVYCKVKGKVVPVLK
jgi:hypothetical protein